MQADAQLPSAPLKPTCVHLFKAGPCADSRRNYNQAMEQWNQQNIAHREQIAASEASAPLQQQIATQQQQITTLQQQIQTDAPAALQARAAAHTQGMEQGAGMGLGASLILFVLIYGIRKLTGN